MEKKVNGLRTAVRYGKLSKEQAVKEYKQACKKSGFTSPSFERWISNRKEK